MSRIASCSPWMVRCVAALAVLSVLCPQAHAQVEAGRVVDDSTQQPVLHVEVSLQQQVANTWKVVERTRTDSAGLFQLAGHDPGVYRVAFSGSPMPFATGPIDTLTELSFNQREYAIPLLRSAAERSAAARTSLGLQFEQPVEAMGGTKPLPYPPELLNARIKTSVIAQYVVDTSGHADLRTLQLLTRPPHRAFGDAVYTFLQSAKFRPARVDGVPVRQLVRQEFIFDP